MIVQIKILATFAFAVQFATMCQLKLPILILFLGLTLFYSCSQSVAPHSNSHLGEVIDIPIIGDSSVPIYSIWDEAMSENFLFVIASDHQLSDSAKAHWDELSKYLQGINIFLLNAPKTDKPLPTPEDILHNTSGVFEHRYLRVLEFVKRYAGPEARIVSYGNGGSSIPAIYSNYILRDQSVGTVLEYPISLYSDSSWMVSVPDHLTIFYKSPQQIKQLDSLGQKLKSKHIGKSISIVPVPDISRKHLSEAIHEKFDQSSD